MSASLVDAQRRFLQTKLATIAEDEDLVGSISAFFLPSPQLGLRSGAASPKTNRAR
jgi:hypothetical protein